MTYLTAGVEWPVMATHAVVYNMATWPCGWGKEASVMFFDSSKEFEQWKEKTAHWAELEDNDYAYQAYEWDWGPCLLDDNRQTGNIGSTYEQRHLLMVS